MDSRPTEKRKHARVARLNRQVFRYMVVLALLWGGTSAVLHLPWRLNASKADIVVRGNHVVTSQQVKTALGDVTGPQIFQLDPRKLERVEALQAVKYAFVRRYVIPKPTIVVHIGRISMGYFRNWTGLSASRRHLPIWTIDSAEGFPDDCSA